jgi:putative acetyltransferase
MVKNYMQIRKFENADIDAIIGLFHSTVHEINRKDYSEKQLDAWAPGSGDRDEWRERLNGNITYVAVDDTGNIAGFGDISEEGHIDMLYVDKDHQGQGAGSKILEALEFNAEMNKAPVIDADVSITAMGFFENRGYRVIGEQKALHNGVEFINYKMVKQSLQIFE